ncbi:MAG: M3 family oligoendopeptidase [Chloroflexia bacterium]|nr:M3 family oligoendopeptidase [Chloroflexia bacterium]
MFDNLPQKPEEILRWSWPQIQPYFEELSRRQLNAGNVAEFLADWTAVADRISEAQRRLYLATARNTADQEVEQAYEHYLDEIAPQAKAADQALIEKLLESGLEPAGFEVPLLKLRTQAALFREENLPLLTREQKMSTEYNKIIGAQTVEWEGEEVTLSQLRPIYQESARQRREKAWRLTAARQLEDREAINDLWRRFLELRLQLAANADQPDYRAYRWREMLRLDYTPEDCQRFQRSIEQVVVPAASRLYEKRRQRLGVDSLRPWDLDVDPTKLPPLQPFSTAEDLKQGASRIFHQVDPQLGAYFDTMIEEDLLDLINRKNKAPGAFCTTFYASKRPFIFGNAVGLQRDVQTVLHESGHAFHAFEVLKLPYLQQRWYGLEFAEVASMSMELLAGPYLTKEHGGFYDEAGAARARLEELESILTFWPYMAVVDAFQHWVYTHPEQAMNAANCDQQWGQLWDRFMPGVDWSGLEEERVTGWHRKQHIHRSPFYYVEYGLAQLGAVLVWRNALRDQTAAVAQYRQALALGGTRRLPELYAAAGAKLDFGSETLREAVALVEQTIEELDSSL